MKTLCSCKDPSCFGPLGDGSTWHQYPATFVRWRADGRTGIVRTEGGVEHELLAGIQLHREMRPGAAGTLRFTATRSSALHYFTAATVQST